MADRLRQLKTIHIGHVAVGQQQGVVSAAPHIEGDGAVLGHFAGVSQQAQLLLNYIAIGLVVFGHQNQPPATAGVLHLERRRCRCACGWGLVGCLWRGQATAGNGHCLQHIDVERGAHVQADVSRKGLAIAAHHADDADAGRQFKRIGWCGDDRAQHHHGRASRCRLLKVVPGGCQVWHHRHPRSCSAAIGHNDPVRGLIAGNPQHMNPLQSRFKNRHAVGPGTMQRQCHLEFRSRALGALHRDGSPHQFNQTPGDGQPEPGAAEFAGGARIGLRKRLKQFRQHLLAHADAIVCNPEPHAGAGIGQVTRLDKQHDARRLAVPYAGELGCVTQQVDQHLTQPRRVARDPVRQLGCHEYGQVNPLGTHCANDQQGRPFDHLAQMGGHALHLQLVGLDLGKIENVIDDVQQRLRRIVDGVEHAPLLGRQGRLHQDIDHADHAVHRGTNLVAHVGQERCLGLRRGEGGLFGLPLFGDVSK